MRNRINSYIKQFFLKPLFHFILKRNNKFNNRYYGQEAYLIGDGISIKYFDLKYFSDKLSIPISYTHFHKDAGLLNICFSIINEPFYFYPYFKLPFPPYTYWKNDIQKLYRRFRRLKPDVPFFTNISNLPVFLGKHNYFLFDDFINSEFTKELKQNGLKPFDGSVRTGIVLAHYFGFRKLYLVGFDYTHNPSVALHYYEKGKGQVVELADHNLLFFKIAKRHIDCITITTNNLKSKYLDSISYGEFTSAELKYRENHDIVDLDILHTLNSWPDYKIY